MVKRSRTADLSRGGSSSENGPDEGIAVIDRFWQDLRQAWRSLNRARAFSGAVAATFALGMAGAISMFALIEGILLRPLAVPNEDQLVVGWRQLSDSASGHWPFRTMDIDTLRAGSRRLESIAGVGYNDPSPLALVDGGSVTFVQGARVGGDFFRVLGAGPALGRTLTARDDVTGAENVLVITLRAVAAALRRQPRRDRPPAHDLGVNPSRSSA